MLLTGLVIMQKQAFGQIDAPAETRFSITLALKRNRSLRSIPGLRAIPAQITTTLLPSSALGRSSPAKPFTATSVGIWLKSTAIPGVTGATSYKANLKPAGNFIFNNRDNACPIPPAAPRTVIFIAGSNFVVVMVNLIVVIKIVRYCSFENSRKLQRHQTLTLEV